MIRATSLVLLLLCGHAFAAEKKQVQVRGGNFVGSAGCSSSSCHGGAGEKRSQFITWSRRDVHAGAFATLTNARSERIAATLGIGPATSSTRCTTCHAPFHAAPPQRLASTADPREGVSCESCHGAASGWLRGHTRPDWTYATRVGAGMRDLKSTYVRANTCVACHQNLDGDIAAAGHPPLVFELSRQLAAQPPHWRDPAGIEVRAWIVGQAVALRELSWKLSLGQTDPHTLAQWNALAWLLSEITSAEKTLLKIDPPGGGPPAFARTQQQADALARRAAGQHFSSAIAARLLRRLLDTGPEFVGLSQEIGYRRAERLMLAIGPLAATAKLPQRPVALPRPEGEGFDARTFAAWLDALRASFTE